MVDAVSGGGSAAERARADWRPFVPVALAAAASALLVAWASGSALFAASFAAGTLALAASIWLAVRLTGGSVRAPPAADWSVGHAIAAQADDPVAVTDRAGRLVCANAAYGALFGAERPPMEAWSAETDDPAATRPLVDLARVAWRDGGSDGRGLASPAGPLDVAVRRTGEGEDLLVWRLSPRPGRDLAAEAAAALGGELGDRLGRAGIMAALVDGEGRMRTATRAWAHRATGDLVGGVAGREVAEALRTEPSGVIRFTAEGPGGPALRLLHLPLDEMGGGSVLFAVDDATAAGGVAPGGGELETITALLDLVPAHLALVDRDGRLLALNAALRQSLGGISPPRYPGDLVVADDKAALADHVRRLSGARALSGDIAVRLAQSPDEPVTVTASSVRGLGAAAVLLAVRDDGPAAPLRAETAQQNKMEAVGHLAGGVAHDFNNLLTAILGICDLMLMRHLPGDSDFDDIQQIRSNSNRAASLTRHLLAFSRQQTLRPQVVLLPDLLSEVTHLLKRLLGEGIVLEVEHAREQGPVRVDAPQLEQVVVNLAVNARDAMPDGGTLTIETYAVSAREVREQPGSGLPVADYTALRVTDTGPGIPPAVLPKIFDPFFTTKELGKGTGLGLSTVYGIVRQSGGFIAVDKAPNGGARFTIHLPVHTGPLEVRAESRRRVAADWGQGTILLVEDEDMVRSVAQRALSRAGYTVRAAASGDEALALLAADPAIDAVVSDVAMPGLDGPQTVRAVRERLPDVPVLFMSGYAEEHARRRIDVDNAAFLPKPFSVAQLTDAVARLLPEGDG